MYASHVEIYRECTEMYRDCARMRTSHVGKQLISQGVLFRANTLHCTYDTICFSTISPMLKKICASHVEMYRECAEMDTECAKMRTPHVGKQLISPSALLQPILSIAPLRIFPGSIASYNSRLPACTVNGSSENWKFVHFTIWAACMRSKVTRLKLSMPKCTLNVRKCNLAPGTS